MAERRLLHRYNPTMDTTEGGDVEDNAVRGVRRALGGSFHPGKVAWGEPMSIETQRPLAATGVIEPVKT